MTLTPRMACNLAELCAEVLTDLDTGGSVAPLLTRPGRVDLVPSDRAWARGLASAAAAADVHMRPLFVATGAAIHAVDTSVTGALSTAFAPGCTTMSRRGETRGPTP